MEFSKNHARKELSIDNAQKKYKYADTTITEL